MASPTKLADIAKALNLSKSTVSRALRGSPQISLATRQKVSETAAAMHYVPDPISSLLGQRKGGKRTPFNIGALSVNPLDLPSLIETGKRYGYEVIAITLTEDLTPKRLAQVLKARGVRGVIVGSSYSKRLANTYPWNEIPWDEFAWVQFREFHTSFPLHRIIANALRSSLTLLEAVYAKGYRDILIVHLDPRNSRTTARQHAAALHFAALHPDTRLRYHITDEGAFSIAGQAKPEVLILHTWLWRLLPEDWKTIPWASFSVPQGRIEVAGIRESTKDLHEAAIDFLDLLLRRDDRGIPHTRHTLLIDGTWHDGASLPDK